MGKGAELTMPRVTYFAVLPFSRDADGDFLAEAAIEARDAEQARAIAARMEGGEGKGAVAFSAIRSSASGQMP